MLLESTRLNTAHALIVKVLSENVPFEMFSGKIVLKRGYTLYLLLKKRKDEFMLADQVKSPVGESVETAQYF